jgi:hypothetical protein
MAPRARNGLAMKALVLVLVLASHALAQGPAPAEIFPMQTGAWWLYRGEVAWTGDRSRVYRKQLDWKMEVAETVQSGRYKAALLIGHPGDLTWYEAGRGRGCYVLIAVDGKRFYLRRYSLPPSRITLADLDLAALIDDQNLILKLPIAQGDSFGADPRRGINDGMYEWCVEAVRRATLQRIHGISGKGPWTEYLLAYRTNPDHEVETYVPGIGLTAYIYSHHGTASEVNVKLIEFHRRTAK